LPNQPPTAPTANLGGAVVDPITSGSEQPAPSGDTDPQQSVTFSEALAGTIPRGLGPTLLGSSTFIFAFAMIPIMSLGIIFSIILLWMRVQHHHSTLIRWPRLNLKNSLVSSYLFFQIWNEYFGVSQFFLQHTYHTVLLPIIRNVRNQILFKFIFLTASTF